MMLAELPSLFGDAAVVLGLIATAGGVAIMLGKWFTKEVRDVVTVVVAPIKEDLGGIAAKNAETSAALIAHMDDEARLRAIEDEARALSRAEDVAWRHEVTERLNNGDERFLRVEAKIDKALAKPSSVTEITGTVELHEAGA